MAGRVRNLSKFLLLALIVVLISLYVVSKFTEFRRAEVGQAPPAQGSAVLQVVPETGSTQPEGTSPGETGEPVAPALAPSGPAAPAASPGEGGGSPPAAGAVAPGSTGAAAPSPAGGGGSPAGGPSAAGSPAASGGTTASPPEGPGLVVPFGLPSSSATAGGLEGLAFTDYRLERERGRGQEAEWLKDLCQDPDADPETRAEAGRRLLELTTRGAREAELEGLIRAKGFDDALVFLFSGSAVVLVKAGQLTAGEAARIGDVVSRGAGVKLEDISIMCRPR